MAGFFLSVALVAALFAQVSFALLLRDTQPFAEVLPEVPTERALAAASFGDEQFLYRQLVMDLQNFGDTGGRWTALREYDMAGVVDWLQTLDHLDVEAQHHVTLAAYYFSQTQNKPDVLPLVRYIQERVRKDPEHNLQWISAALHLSRVRLKDEELVLEIARQLGGYSFPEMSVIAYQLPAFIHEGAGRFEEAAMYMDRALKALKHRVSEREVIEMQDFIIAMRARAQSAGS